MKLEYQVNGNAAKQLHHQPTGETQEITRLMIQALGDMGFTDTMKCLSKESNVQVESPQVLEFRNAVLGGDWSHAEVSLQHLELSDQESLPVGHGKYIFCA